MNTQGPHGTHESPVRVILHSFVSLFSCLLEPVGMTLLPSIGMGQGYLVRRIPLYVTQLVQHFVGHTLSQPNGLMVFQGPSWVGLVHLVGLDEKILISCPPTSLLVGLQSIFKEGIFSSLISCSSGFTPLLGRRKEFWWENVTRGALWLVNLNGRVPSFPVPLRPINSPTSPLSLPFSIFLFLLLSLEIPFCRLSNLCRFPLLPSFVFISSSSLASCKFFSLPFSFYSLFLFH